MKKNAAAANDKAEFFNPSEYGEEITGAFIGWETSDFGNKKFKPAVIMVLSTGKVILNANLKNTLRQHKEKIKKGAVFTIRYDNSSNKGKTLLKYYTVYCGKLCLNPPPQQFQRITTAQVFE